jgi:antitoxin component of MazEF toxin-antitoxin module
VKASHTLTHQPVERKPDEVKRELPADLEGLVRKWANAGSGRASITVAIDTTGDDPIEVRYSAHVEIGDGQIVVSQTKRATLAEMIASVEGQLK